MAGSGQKAGSATQPSVNAWLLRSLELCCTGSGITNPRIPNSRVIQEPQSSSDPRSQSTSDVLDTRGFGYTFQGLLFEIPSYRRQHFPLPLEQSIRRTLCGPPPLVSVHPGQASRVSFPPPPESNPLPRHGSFTPVLPSAQRSLSLVLSSGSCSHDLLVCLSRHSTENSVSDLQALTGASFSFRALSLLCKHTSTSMNPQPMPASPVDSKPSENKIMFPSPAGVFSAPSIGTDTKWVLNKYLFYKRMGELINQLISKSKASSPT